MPAARAQEGEPAVVVYGGLSVPLGDSGSDAGVASLLVNPADEDVYGFEDIGRYFVILVVTGLRYQAELSLTLDGYGVGQAGVAVARGPRGEIGDTDFASGFMTGFGFGGGIVLNDRINITARYLILGEPEFEYEIEGPGGDGEGEAEVKINVLQIMIGIPVGGGARAPLPDSG